MKRILRNFCFTLIALISVHVASKAAGELAGVEYKNVKINSGGTSFTFEVWGYAVQPSYTTAAVPWSTFNIRIDLSLAGGATDIGPMTAANIVYGIAKEGIPTNDPPGGIAPKLGINLTRGAGPDLTATSQMMARITVPVTGGIITSASLLSTRLSPANPSLTQTFWTSSVAPTTRRALVVPDDRPLPVKLTYFSASREGTSPQAQLAWATTEEVNASRFEIQRSSDIKKWATLGNLAAAGNSQATNSYQFTDAAPLNGNNYYRLKIIDQDETFAYSRIESLTMGSDQQVTIFPNPASDVLYVQNTGINYPTGVSIISADGKTTYQTNANVASGISVKNLNNGLYILNVTTADGMLSKHKVLISK